MDSMLELQNVKLSLTGGGGTVNILRGVDLQAEAGETLSIVGPSGAGKTTLLMVMGGLERPDEGAVFVAGQNLAAMHEDALARFRRSKVGIVFQSFHLIGTMTALENAALPLEFAGVANALRKAQEALGAVGLGDRVAHYPSQLSGGEQQRVALARAFVAHPALILADEPTGNLDIDTGESVIRLLFDMQAHYGTSLVLVTHDLALARRCDRQLHMIDGRIREDEGSFA
ncbi:MAG: ABC transporter ATP-binding protein [Kiritimatiellia bacterium]